MSIAVFMLASYSLPAAQQEHKSKEIAIAL